jgi:hypothetical protein
VAISKVHKPTCPHMCDSGFNVRDVDLSSLRLTVPMYICKGCGYKVISTQLFYIGGLCIIRNKYKDYDSLLKYFLKEER